MMILAESAVAFLVTYSVTPLLIKKLKEHGIVGADAHKPRRPICAEMGGLGVLIGFVVAFGFASLISFEVGYRMLPAFLTIIFAGFIGIVDDLFTLRQRYKPFLVALASTPLILVNIDRVEMWLPSFGWIYLGSLYLILIPLAVATASNLTNMLAGFNGLEAGVGTISCFSLGFLLANLGRWDSASLAFSLSAAFFAFLFYNWYPAKIFPGDTGTLVSGAAIAAISISGGVEAAGIVMMVPSAIDFTLKMLARSPFSGRKKFGDTVVAKDGTLIPPGYAALAHAFMNVAQLKEKDLVLALLLMQALYSLLGVFLVLFFK
jgi:UDP-N-acetylglucosamine--dolichyl-phosphate N-acetylglucosaminephosphotransferase